MLNELMQGLLLTLQPMTLLYVFLGVFIGTFVGVLPGLGPTATIALLLPLTYTMEPTQAVIMLAGIYYGSMYGGSITSILLRIPGEAATVVTSFDGYAMTKAGRAGPALGMQAIASFLGGTAAVVGLTVMAPLMVKVSSSFGPPEYVALAVIGLTLVTYLGNGRLWKAIAMAALGLWLATLGTDPISGSQRFTFGTVSLFDGLDFVAVAMGLFGVGELLHNIEHSETGQKVKASIKGIWPTKDDFRKSAGPIARGSILGFFIGVLPGGGGVVSSMASYVTEKQVSKTPEKFGRGAIEGVAGPEAANNASSTAAFIPLLTLGLPPNVVLALIYGALLIQGITPSPQLISEHPEVFWGVIASMYVGNIMLIILNIPLVGIFVNIMRIKPGILTAFALLITLAGVYSINNDWTDMVVLLVFGVIGWLMKKASFEPGPLVLAFVLGPILEQSFRQSMLLADGNAAVFFQRPISGTMLALLAVAIFASTVAKVVSRQRRKGESKVEKEALKSCPGIDGGEAVASRTSDSKRLDSRARSLPNNQKDHDGD